MPYQITKAVMAAVCLISFGSVVTVSAATAYLQQTQLEQFWSGGDWKDSTKDSTTYNANGKPVDIIRMTWNATAARLVLSLRMSFEYDSKNEATQIVNSTWNKTAGNWDTASGLKWTRTRNASSKVTDVVQQYWSNAQPTQRWYNIDKSSFAYDTAGDTATWTYVAWDTSIGDWNNVWLRTFTNDASGKLVVQTTQAWSNADRTWIKSTRDSYAYNANGKLIADSTEAWSSTGGGGYISASKRTYAYNTNGLMSEMITLSWSNAKGIFVNVRKETYTYDANSKRLTLLNQRWTTDPLDNGLWLNVSRYTDTYNAKSLLLTDTYDTYDSAAGNWDKATLQNWAYDANDNASEEIFKNWNTTTSQYDNARRLTWSYLETSVGVLAGVAPAIMQKPVIVAGRSNAIISGVKNAGISIFGMDGRQVTKLAVGEGSPLVVWNYTDSKGMRVSAGSYVMKITGNGSIGAYPITVCR